MKLKCKKLVKLLNECDKYDKIYENMNLEKSLEVSMVYFNEKRLEKIRLNDNNFYVVMDFDMTITTPDSDNSWSILENPNFMDCNMKKESRLLYEEYYPYELDYTLDFNTKTEFISEWYYKNMDLFYKYGLTHDILINCVKNGNVSFRKGFKEFLFFLYKHNIPVIIVSAGIGNVIYELLNLHNCLFSNVHIISNFINFDNNVMLPFTDEMIHSCNKCIRKLPQDLNNQIRDKDYILLFGDLIEDLQMVPNEDLLRTLSFGFLEKKVDDNLPFYKDSFDVVLTDNSSFYDVQSVFNRLKND